MHRMSSTNEISGRYSILEMEFYIPDPNSDRIKGKGKFNKQGSEGELDIETKEYYTLKLNEYNKLVSDLYDDFNEMGISNELARLPLPLNLYTEWYWKIDLHNLFRFLKLRTDSHAQQEIRDYAQVIEKIVQQSFPLCYNAWDEFIKSGVRLSRTELDMLKHLLKQINIQGSFDKILSEENHLQTFFNNQRHKDNFLNKLE